MVDPVVEDLILDLFEWIAMRERTYNEVMDACRTSCPKLPVWEEANDRGLVTSEASNGSSIVQIALRGTELLRPRRASQPVEDGMEKAT